MSAHSSSAVVPDQRDSRGQLIRAAQVELLYSNVNVGVVVNLVAATVLGRLQWAVIPHKNILGWWLGTLLVTVGRFSLGRLYLRATTAGRKTRTWATAFTIGAALSGAGWGAACIFLYAAD